MDNLDICKTCFEKCDTYENPSLLCEGLCGQRVHVRCLERGALPSNFIGDVFYDFQCNSCTDSKEELIVRQKLPWLTVLILTLYNLREKSSGISRRGYFHWKSDISIFINNNWEQLFGKTVKRKKNWIGTISGTLSHYSGIFFKSGTAELGDQGWWKLNNNDPPEVLVEKYNKILADKIEQKRQQQAKNKGKSFELASLRSESNVTCEVEKSSDITTQREKVEREKREKRASAQENYTHREVKITNPAKKQRNESQKKVPKSNATNEDFNDILDLEIDVPTIEEDFPCFNLTGNSIIEDLPFDCSEISNDFITECLQDVPEVVESSSEIVIDDAPEEINVSDTTFMNNVETAGNICKEELIIDDSNEQSQEIENVKSYDLPPPQPSLFRQSTPRPWPWDESIKINPDDVRPLMSEREEEFLLQKMEQYKHLLDTAPPTVRRLYRKLAVRKLKRQYGLPIVNIDALGTNAPENLVQIKKKGNIVLDRFISEDVSIFFEQRLQGYCDPTSVHSPYTSRLLKPYIRRDTTSRPLWLRVMNELLTKVNKKTPDWKCPPIAPIDYSYVRPQHIPAMNSLCTQFFWPGVDLTECLQYPDFTCVVLYKKVVIGFAVMIPDVGYNEAYISFFLVRPEWQKAGIGTFMLYHLIQTCMGKDITLHVSATNPALILYQKFGFKQEEFIQDFYDKYILPSSKESKHALLLRLKR